MGALLNPVDRAKGSMKWALVAQTAVMFSFLTINTATNLDLPSISFIDNRAFPGNEGLPPGPFAYQSLLTTKGAAVVSNVLFVLNNWLADGLLVSSG
jgi:hypothetical protein